MTARRIIGRCHGGKTADADTDIAIALVDEHLADMGGPELGWDWSPEYKDLARTIARLIGRVRAAERRR